MIESTKQREDSDISSKNPILWTFAKCKFEKRI